MLIVRPNSGIIRGLKISRCSWQYTPVRRASSTRRHDPLRILFCGADEFSNYSLEALHKLKQAHPDIISSIDVLCKTDKASGRGLKTIRAPPIKSTALTLGLPLHQIDTFTGWTPPFSFNLIIAVSFGLLIPPRILTSATYGGLNVHPSILPDFRGPAPIHRCLLNGDNRTGVSLQTLHPTAFDRGEIVLQTPWLPIPENSTVASLLPTLGTAGADLLTTCLKKKRFLPPYHVRHTDRFKIKEYRPFRHAPKITSADHEVDIPKHRSPLLLRKSRVLGKLSVEPGLTRFLQAISPFKATDPIQLTGLKIVKGSPLHRPEYSDVRTSPYCITRLRKHPDEELKTRRTLFIRSVDNKFLTPEYITVPGRPKKATRDFVEELLANAPRRVREEIEQTGRIAEAEAVLSSQVATEQEDSDDGDDGNGDGDAESGSK
ncbi:hypothetical protein MBLNU457_g0375t1 [Dothideomycetes sp. NU457]